MSIPIEQPQPQSAQPWDPAPYPPLEFVAPPPPPPPPAPYQPTWDELQALLRANGLCAVQITPPGQVRTPSRPLPTPPQQQQPVPPPRGISGGEPTLGSPGLLRSPALMNPANGKSLMKEPPVFKGDKASYREWKRKLIAWLTDEKNKICSDHERINIALSYMDGEKVSDWIQNYYENNFSQTHLIWRTTWSSFITKLDETFLDTARHADARVRFERARQGKDETASVFFERFEVLINQAQYDKDQMHVLQKIEQAVHAPLMDSVYVNSLGRIPKTFAEWKTLVVNMDEMTRCRNESKRLWGFGSNSGSWFLASKPQTQAQAPKAAASDPAGDQKDGTGVVLLAMAIFIATHH